MVGKIYIGILLLYDVVSVVIMIESALIEEMVMTMVLFLITGGVLMVPFQYERLEAKAK